MLACIELAEMPVSSSSRSSGQASHLSPSRPRPICVNLRFASVFVSIRVSYSCPFAVSVLRFLCLFAARRAVGLAEEGLFVLFVASCLCVRFYSRIFVACRAIGFAKADPFAVTIREAHLSFVICHLSFAKRHRYRGCNQSDKPEY